MGNLIKNDVTDQDIENLFDNNDSKQFTGESDTSNNNEESLIPRELDVSVQGSTNIQRPDTYNKDEFRDKKIQAKKEALALKTANQEKLLQTAGNVSTDVFNEIAKARQKAQLEEFISKQRKLPKIDTSAKYKLYASEPKCTFHVYQPINILDGGRMQCSCKFCSQEKIFTNESWKQYELENRQFM